MEQRGPSVFGEMYFYADKDDAMEESAFQVGKRVGEPPFVAAARIDQSAKTILAMDIVVNDRTYRFNEVVSILLSSSWPWECFAEAVQTDKLYTLKPRAPYQ